MTHNEKRSNPMKEAGLALFTGLIFGGTHTISGHPLDTIKTHMQLVKPGETKLSAFKLSSNIWKNEGLVGFFRGCIPPLWGSMVYRGLMMSAYEGTYTYIDQNFDKDDHGKEHFMKTEMFLGLRPITPISAMMASFARGLFEGPIEYAKLMGQTKQPFEFSKIYRGLHLQILRTTVLLMPIFSAVDIARRHTDMMKTLGGSFIVVSGAAGASYMVAWPLETLKNLAQTGIPHPNATFTERLNFLGGPLGLYRGMAPGCISGSFRNGCGMVAMIYAQKWATQLGLRD